MLFVFQRVKFQHPGQGNHGRHPHEVQRPVSECEQSTRFNVYHAGKSSLGQMSQNLCPGMKNAQFKLKFRFGMFRNYGKYMFLLPCFNFTSQPPQLKIQHVCSLDDVQWNYFFAIFC